MMSLTINHTRPVSIPINIRRRNNMLNHFYRRCLPCLTVEPIAVTYKPVISAVRQSPTLTTRRTIIVKDPRDIIPSVTATDITPRASFAIPGPARYPRPPYNRGETTDYSPTSTVILTFGSPRLRFRQTSSRRNRDLLACHRIPRSTNTQPTGLSNIKGTRKHMSVHRLRTISHKLLNTRRNHHLNININLSFDHHKTYQGLTLHMLNQLTPATHSNQMLTIKIKISYHTPCTFIKYQMVSIRSIHRTQFIRLLNTTILRAHPLTLFRSRH